jgi:hypothetical protein
VSRLWREKNRPNEMVEAELARVNCGKRKAEWQPDYQFPPGVAYGFRLGEGPLTFCHLRLTLTSTRSATLMKGIPLFIP